MRHVARSLVFAFLVVPFVGRAQSPQVPTEDLRFEVASIRRNTSGEQAATALMSPSGLYTLRNRSVLFLLTSSFGVPAANVFGVPDWVRNDRYDLVIQTGRGAVRGEELVAMTRNLLRERFNLVAHLENSERDVYLLSRTRDGDPATPQMTPSPLNCSDPMVRQKVAALPPRTDGLPYCGFANEGGRIYAGSMTMATFSLVLGPISGRPVVDRTGLMGGFDVKLEWTAALGAPEAISIFTALQEQLNLRLMPATEPIEVLVVDRIERPSEN